MFSLEIINAINESGTARGGVAKSKARYWINKGIEVGLQEAIAHVEELRVAVYRTPANRITKTRMKSDLTQIENILIMWRRHAQKNKPGLGLANRVQK